MAVFSRATIELWPVAVVAVVATAVPIGFELASRSFTLSPPKLTGPRGDYPIRFELPPARPPASGEPATELEYDLADSGGSAIEIRKPVRLNGADAGNATVRVAADSTLSIAASELRALLARAGRGDLARQIGGGVRPGRFVDFEAMRRLGIDVRYDVAADRIVIAA